MVLTAMNNLQHGPLLLCGLFTHFLTLPALTVGQLLQSIRDHTQMVACLYGVLISLTLQTARLTSADDALCFWQCLVSRKQRQWFMLVVFGPNGLVLLHKLGYCILESLTMSLITFLHATKISFCSDYLFPVLEKWRPEILSRLYKHMVLPVCLLKKKKYEM